MRGLLGFGADMVACPGPTTRLWPRRRRDRKPAVRRQPLTLRPMGGEIGAPGYAAGDGHAIQRTARVGSGGTEHAEFSPVAAAHRASSQEGGLLSPLPGTWERLPPLPPIS